MIRFLLRRLAIIPGALLLVDFLGFAYAHLVRPGHLARNPYWASFVDPEPLLPAYGAYMSGLLRLDFGTLPRGQGLVIDVVLRAAGASLGLLAIALALSVITGLLLGLRAVRTEPPSVRPWLTSLTTFGLAMPSFYIGSLLVMGMIAYMIWGPAGKVPLPVQGFGWDNHLVLPVLVLMVRPAAQIAQVTAGLLAAELSKNYVMAARSVGHSWQSIRRKHALRNILVPIVVTISGSLRLLAGELIIVEWLFNWPGLGRLLASTLIPSNVSSSPQRLLFLFPPLLAMILVVLAILFLGSDTIATLLSRVLDPRQRTGEEEMAGG